MLATQKHYYEVLDGLRGIAAIIILIFHYLEMIYTDYSESILGHGFLAVDFFFCLSGFVIGLAYNSRISKIGLKGFFKNRLIRLHPLVIFGSIIGLTGYLLDPFVDKAIAPDACLIILAFIGSILLIPTPFLPYRGGGLFPYNTPSWSLFYEYIINIFYAFILIRMGKKMLLLFGFICAGWLTFTSYSAGWLIGGWDLGSLIDGFPRVFYSFSAGLIVFRFKLIWKNKFGFLLPLLLLIGIFVFPHYENDWITESVLVVACFPLILIIGAGASVSGRLQKICLFIGKLSYPLYMTHITTVWIFGNYYNMYKPEGLKLWSIVGLLIIFNLIFAYLVMQFYDEPIQKWLKRKYRA